MNHVFRALQTETNDQPRAEQRGPAQFVPRLNQRVFIPLTLEAFRLDSPKSLKRLRVFLAGVSLILLCALSGCGGSLDPSLRGKFETAEAAFAAAGDPNEFRRVAAMYQEIVDAGVVSGVLLYNQGNAFMRAGMPGRAVASYRQAARFRPRDTRLAANLQAALARSSTTSLRKPLVEHLLFWQDWLSYPEKFQLATFTSAITFLIAVICLWARRRWLWWLRAASFAMSVVLVVSAGYDWYRFAYVKRGVVVAESVEARKGNGEGFEPAFNQPLGETTEFRVVEQRDAWMLIRLAERQEAWIPREAAVIY